MTVQFYLSPESYQNLITHLVNFEEQRDNILNEYYPELNQERLDVSALIAQYIDVVAKIIEDSAASPSADQTFPRVIIGSEVTIRDLANQETVSYSISGPYHEQFTWDDISYLSPVGRALLLKKVGEVVKVKTPSGVMNYEILAIIYGQSKEPVVETI